MNNTLYNDVHNCALQLSLPHLPWLVSWSSPRSDRIRGEGSHRTSAEEYSPRCCGAPEHEKHWNSTRSICTAATSSSDVSVWGASSHVSLGGASSSEMEVSSASLSLPAHSLSSPLLVISFSWSPRSFYECKMAMHEQAMRRKPTRSRETSRSKLSPSISTAPRGYRNLLEWAWSYIETCTIRWSPIKCQSTITTVQIKSMAKYLCRSNKCRSYHCGDWQLYALLEEQLIWVTRCWMATRHHFWLLLVYNSTTQALP